MPVAASVLAVSQGFLATLAMVFSKHERRVEGFVDFAPVQDSFQRFDIGDWEWEIPNLQWILSLLHVPGKRFASALAEELEGTCCTGKGVINLRG